MKAAFLAGPRRFELRDLDEPVAPDGGLVLAVKACGVCGSDLRRWKEGPPAAGDAIIPGHEAAGVVAAVGRNTSGWAPGDRIAIAPDVHCGACWYCRRGLYNLCDTLRLIGITPGYSGAFAERMVLTGEILANGIVHRMPDGLAFDQAAVAEPCCSVLAAHDKAGTAAGDTVVVLGAGPIGCLHAVIAKSCGARAVVSEPAESRRRMAEIFAPDLIIDPSSEDAVAAVRRFTNGLGADIVICANPIASTQTQAVEMVRKAGRVVLFGGLPKSSPMVSLDANRIHYGEIMVVGAFSYHPEVHARALDLVHRNVIPADRLITHRYPLKEIDAAFETAARGEGLKVVVTM